MPRASVTKNHFQFSKGLITETTKLSFPENSMSAAVNIDLNFDGSISRRLGLKKEDNNSSINMISLSGGEVLQTHVWENAGESRNRDILVVKLGNTLRFYDLSTTTVSQNYLGYILLGSSATTTNVSFANGNGYLLVAYGSWPIVIEFDGTTFTGTSLNPKIRDLEGIDDGTDADVSRIKTSELTGSLKAQYVYNLLNQGWPAKLVRKPGGGLLETWDIFELTVGSLPSHSDKYISEAETYNPEAEKSLDTSSNSPSRGRFLLDMFSLDRVAALDTLTDACTFVTNNVKIALGAHFPAEVIEEKPTVAGFYQGHAVFGGVYNKRYSSQVFFSQSVKTVHDMGKFYSVNDPTKDIESSPLATDGGIITVHGMGKLVKIQELAQWCVLFADNGIWAIRGEDDGLFSVSSAVVVKLSDVGAVGIDNIVSIESSIIYWGDQGIYAITIDPNSGALGVQSLTEESIDTLYKGVSNLSRKYSSGVFDKINKKVYWLYNSSLTSQSGPVSFYDKAIVLDVRLQAFYEYAFPEVSSSSMRLSHPIYKRDLVVDTSSLNVVAGIDNVVASTNNVIANTLSQTSSDTPSLLFLCVPPNTGTQQATFAVLGDRDFKDWSDEGGDYYSSYVETGHEVLGSPANVKSIGSIYCYFNRTEENFLNREPDGIGFDFPSSCLMTAKWEWTGTGNANRWSSPQQVYRFRVPFISGGDLEPFDYSYDVVVTKNKILGSGKSVVLRFESENGKDFQLLGWALEYYGNSKI